MNIHEYQAKEILREYGIPVPEGKAVLNLTDFESSLNDVKGPPWVVKAQIHAGGRGKAGGVKVTKTREEALAAAQDIYGKTLVTHQTGPEGKEVQRLLIEAGADIQKELYLAFTLDRSKSRVAIIASPEGGMDIEEVAERTPEKIYKSWVHPSASLGRYQSLWLAQRLGVPKEAQKQFHKILTSLYKAYRDLDVALLEINPLIVTGSGEIMALDAKVNFDGNSLFRQPKVAELHDPSEEDPQELEARQFDLSYVSLDGNIGCMVNGAGLAMGTMDIIKHHGGDPANFLDVGGGADENKVREAFKIILKDPKVKAILVNIFGGIMKCDVIAKGVLSAANELSIHVPLVVRLEGTNVKEGKDILDSSSLKIITASSMEEAAKKVVEASEGKVS